MSDREPIITTVNWPKRIAIDSEGYVLTIACFMDYEGDDTKDYREAAAAVAQYETGPYVGQWVAFSTTGFEPVNGNC